jgi:murein hydrolase activator
MTRARLRSGALRRALLVLAAATLSGPGVAALDATDPAPAPVAVRPARASSNAGSPLSDLERTITELGREEQTLRRRFEDLGRRADAAGKRALLRGRAYVRKARAGLLPVGDGFAALVDHAAKLEQLRRSIQKDLAEQRALVVDRARSAERLEEVSRRLGPLRADYEALVRAENALLAVEDRQRAFDRAFSTSVGADHTAVYGASGPVDPSAVAAGFPSMKGRLPFPIAGRSEVKSSRRSSSEGAGLEMRAPLGTTVRAVYPGRVAFADDYADYGKTVIVDHGDRYYTVTANLGAIDVRVGDDVAANARLGSVGDFGRGALVYIEIRVGTSTLDPAEWFGL